MQTDVLVDISFRIIYFKKLKNFVIFITKTLFFAIATNKQYYCYHFIVKRIKCFKIVKITYEIF